MGRKFGGSDIVRTVLAWLVGLLVVAGVGSSVYLLGREIDLRLYSSSGIEFPGLYFIFAGLVFGVGIGVNAGGFVYPLGGLLTGSAQDRADALFDGLTCVLGLPVFLTVYVIIVKAGLYLGLTHPDLASLLSFVGTAVGFFAALLITVEIDMAFFTRPRRKLGQAIRHRQEREYEAWYASSRQSGDNQACPQRAKPAASSRKKPPPPSAHFASDARKTEERLERIKREADKARRRSQTIHRSATQVAADFDAAFREAKRQGVRFSARERLKIDEIRRFLREKLRRSHVERQRVNAEQLDEELRKESK